MHPIDPRGQRKGKLPRCVGLFRFICPHQVNPIPRPPGSGHGLDPFTDMQPEEEIVAEEKDGLLVYPKGLAAAAADSPPNHEETAPPAAVSSGEAVVEERSVIPPHCGDPDGKPDPNCPFDHARLRNGTRHDETQEVAAEDAEEEEMEEQALIPPFCKDPEHQHHRLCPGGRVEEPIDHNRPPSALKMMFTLYPNITTTTAPTPALSRVANGDAAGANATTAVDPNYKLNQWEYDGRSMKWAICILGALGLFGAVLMFRDIRRKNFPWLPMPWDKPVLNAVTNKFYRCKHKVRGLFSKGKGKGNDEEGQQSQKQLSDKGQAQAAAAAAGGVTMEGGAANAGSGSDNVSEGEATLSENFGVLANYNRPAAPAPATSTAGPAAAESNGELPAVPAATFARNPPRLPSLYVEH
ncbi:uncharacterized protein PG986_002755 [Apiospora aurea]|uniref:Uncharacterized protein n=1 Tax=Apiospora aurea TaxID=335848 RepID=A0ABR1QPW9_9PEZI